MLLSNTACLWAAGVSGLAAKGAIFTPLLKTRPSQIKSVKQGSADSAGSGDATATIYNFRLPKSYPALPGCLPQSWRMPLPSTVRTQPRTAQIMISEVIWPCPFKAGIKRGYILLPAAPEEGNCRQILTQTGLATGTQRMVTRYRKKA